MARITIRKFYTLDNGDISGMFHIPKDSATKALRHELIELEGVEAELSPAQAPALITEPLSPIDIRLAIEGHQRAISNLVVQLMDAPRPLLPKLHLEQLPLGRTGAGEIPDEIPSKSPAELEEESAWLRRKGLEIAGEAEVISGPDGDFHVASTHVEAPEARGGGSYRSHAGDTKPVWKDGQWRYEKPAPAEEGAGE